MIGFGLYGRICYESYFIMYVPSYAIFIWSIRIQNKVAFYIPLNPGLCLLENVQELKDFVIPISFMVVYKTSTDKLAMLFRHLLDELWEFPSWKPMIIVNDFDSNRKYIRILFTIL